MAACSTLQPLTPEALLRHTFEEQAEVSTCCLKPWMLFPEHP